jgi:hypothetical protein
MPPPSEWVVDVTDDLVVVDKPPNLPSIPSADNYVDCALIMVQWALGGGKLWPVKMCAFVSQLNRLQPHRFKNARALVFLPKVQASRLKWLHIYDAPTLSKSLLPLLVAPEGRYLLAGIS